MEQNTTHVKNITIILQLNETKHIFYSSPF